MEDPIYTNVEEWHVARTQHMRKMMRRTGDGETPLDTMLEKLAEFDRVWLAHNPMPPLPVLASEAQQQHQAEDHAAYLEHAEAAKRRDAREQERLDLYRADCASVAAAHAVQMEFYNRLMRVIPVVQSWLAYRPR